MNYKKLFIVGCGRSGTTWVWDIFKEHPLVITDYESHLYDSIMQPHSEKNFILEVIFLRPLWMKKILIKSFFTNKFKAGLRWEFVSNRFLAVKGLLSGWVDYDKFCRFVKEAISRKELNNIQRAELVIDEILDDFFIRSGGKEGNILVEKTPRHILYGDYILNHYLEAKIIEVVRDGRDVCVSMKMLNRSWCPHSRKNQIKMWKKLIEAGIKLKSEESFANRILQVRYEDIKKDPAKEIKRMFDFAGISTSVDKISKIINNTNFNNYKDRGKGTDKYKGVVGDWKNHFTEQDKELFNKIAGDLMIKLGYKL